MSSGRVRAWRVAALVAVLVGGCRPAGPAESPSAQGTNPRGSSEIDAIEAPSSLDVRAAEGRPALVALAREGDPRAAMAIAVSTSSGPVAAAALEAVVEARLAAAGFASVVDGSSDRAGYRVRVLIEDGAAIERAVGAMRAALLTPITAADTAALKLAGARVAALRARPLDDAALLPVVDCTGEAQILARDPLPDPSSAGFAAQLEVWRGEHGASTVAMAMVAPGPLLEQGERALAALPAWPVVALREDAWPEELAPSAYVDVGRRRGTAKLSVAVRVRDRGAAISFADRAGLADSALLARMSALPVPFVVRRVAGTLRRAGACISVEAESAGAVVGPIEEAAAVAASVVRQEILVELAAGRDEGQVAARQIRALGDPRDAASAAAFWALSGPGPARPPSSAVVLGVSGGSSRSTAEPTELAGVVGQRFSQAMAKAAAGWARPLLDGNTAVERGQGELWVLLASACPVVEPEGDAGTSALAVLAAASAANGKDGVVVEPWVAADGAGLLAHAAPRAGGESALALAARVADAAARGLLAEPPPAASVLGARATALGRLELTGERGREPVASLLWPGQPSRLAPWGLFESVARGNTHGVRLRWASLVGGPMRVAVLGNASARQAEAAVKAADRWMVRGATPRACSSPPSPSPPAAGLRTAPTPSGQAPRAFVAVGVDAAGAGEVLATATALMLSGDGGLLRRALEDTGATGDAYLLGHGAAAALVIELRGPAASLEPSVAQARALLGRLAKGAATEQDATRAASSLVASDTLARLDPARRVVDLWRGSPVPRPAVQPPALAALRAYQAAQLKDERLLIVLPRPVAERDLPR
jgi:hypothetical protein